MLEEIKRRINDQEEREFQESLLLNTDEIVNTLTIDELILLEAGRDKTEDCMSLVADMMCHILKRVFSTQHDEGLMNRWLDEIVNKSGGALRKICNSTIIAKKYYKAMNASIKDIYYDAVTRYYWDSQKKKGEILLDGLWYIPDICPWVIEEVARAETELDVLKLEQKVPIEKRKRPVFRKRY